jgi:iron(III) transport system permease protein
MTTQAADSRTIAAQATKVRPIVTGEDWLRRGLLLLITGFLLVGVLLPLVPLVVRSLSDQNGQFVGLANYVRYFTSPGLRPLLSTA